MQHAEKHDALNKITELFVITILSPIKMILVFKYLLSPNCITSSTSRVLLKNLKVI